MTEKQIRVEEPDGVLIVNKHKGVTSHDIVNKVRRLYGTRRVGHAGTLDPMATGVLVVLVGRAAKACEYLASDYKQYRAILRLGMTTDTEDTDGKVLSTSDEIPDFDTLCNALFAFRGKIMQIPPMYSALKVGGQKLVDLARRGEVIERQAREVEIYALSAEKTEERSDFVLNVRCSGGTYIRTLCADIGQALGCGGVMAELCRVETCGFSLKEACSISDLEEMTPKDRLLRLIPTEALFRAHEKVSLSAFYEKLCRSGCEIYLAKIGVDLPIGERVRICDGGGNFFALGEVREYEAGKAIKAIKTFQLCE